MDWPRAETVVLWLFAGALGCSASRLAGQDDNDAASGAGLADGDPSALTDTPSETIGPEASPGDPGPEGEADSNTGEDGGSANVPAAPAGSGPEQCVGRAPVVSTWTLAWSDEFDKEGAPDPSNWAFERGFVRNQELQWYQPNNASVAAGLLTIAAQRQQVTNPSYTPGSADWTKARQYAQYTSSSMTTGGKRSFQYGRFEMCAQIDTRVGSWPAFWILGNGRAWPSSGEVDIMEYYAKGVRANVCVPSGSTCDWTGSVTQPLASLGTAWPAEFHLWAMEWNAKDVSLYLDDKLVYDFKISRIPAAGNPYIGNPFYIILNLAIGSNGGDPSNVAFPVTFKVDYVRVYR